MQINVIDQTHGWKRRSWRRLHQHIEQLPHCRNCPLLLRRYANEKDQGLEIYSKKDGNKEIGLESIMRTSFSC